MPDGVVRYTQVAERATQTRLKPRKSGVCTDRFLPTVTSSSTLTIFPQDHLSFAGSNIAIGAVDVISRMCRYCLSWVFHGQEDYAVRKLGKPAHLRNLSNFRLGQLGG